MRYIFKQVFYNFFTNVFLQKYCFNVKKWSWTVLSKAKQIVLILLYLSLIYNFFKTKKKNTLLWVIFKLTTKTFSFSKTKSTSVMQWLQKYVKKREQIMVLWTYIFSWDYFFSKKSYLICCSLYVSNFVKKVFNFIKKTV